jgi:small subunit ribosomal protein S2
VIADAIADGLMARASGAVAGAPADAAVEPLADWEKELLTGSADAEAVEAPVADAAPVEDPATEAPAAE